MAYRFPTASTNRSGFKWLDCGGSQQGRYSRQECKQRKYFARPRPCRQTQKGIFRSDSPAFTFRYPGDFQLIPRGQLEADQRHTRDKPNAYGLDPHIACNTLLFRAQRLRPGERTPQVLSVVDLEPGCIFGIVDRNMLESVASNAINSVANHWQKVQTSKARTIQIEGRGFAEASALALRTEAWMKRSTLSSLPPRLVSTLSGG